MQNRFEDRVSVSPFAQAMVGGIAFLEFWLAYSNRSGPRVGFWIQVAVGAVFAIMFFLCRQFVVSVDRTHLRFGFGPFGKSVPLSWVANAHPDEATLATTGLGIHLAPGGYWAWIARPGVAVRVILSPAHGVGYILSTNRPRDLVAAITTHPSPPPSERESDQGALH